MFEVAGLFLIMCLIASAAFLPLGYSIFSETTTKKESRLSVASGEIGKAMAGEKFPEDSVLRRHCLTHLQSEIEAAFAPRPTDSVLQRHHDTLVAFELEKRLADLQLTA
ncbi:MAG: hypothetical protein ACU83N_15950 [Gammaproteobacteria bacterium]